jgi:hypothetical protein
MSDSELRKYFKFNESDLAANRAGKLSAKQQKALDEAEQGANKIFIGAGIFFVLLALVISWGVTSDIFQGDFSFSNLSTDDKVGIGLGIGLPWLILGFFAYWSFRLAFSKLDNSVQSVEGKVNFVKVEKQQSYSNSDGSTSYRTVQQYELRVGRVAFENVNEELLNTIEEGDTYAFYYTKQAKQILSAELVKKGK